MLLDWSSGGLCALPMLIFYKYLLFLTRSFLCFYQEPSQYILQCVFSQQDLLPFGSPRQREKLLKKYNSFSDEVSFRVALQLVFTHVFTFIFFFLNQLNSFLCSLVLLNMKNTKTVWFSNLAAYLHFCCNWLIINKKWKRVVIIHFN